MQNIVDKTPAKKVINYPSYHHKKKIWITSKLLISINAIWVLHIVNRVMHLAAHVMENMNVNLILFLIHAGSRIILVKH